MWMPDLRIGNNFIDANFLDRTGGPEDTAVDTILRLYREDAFTLLLPYSVQAEIKHPNTPADVKRKAEQFIYSNEVELTAPECATYYKTCILIRGNAQPGQHEKDAFHLFESQKNGGRFFITKDGRLLKKADEILENLPPLRVVKPSEFLTAYSTHSEKRHLHL
jgi:hypothetical protein